MVPKMKEIAVRQNEKEIPSVGALESASRSVPNMACEMDGNCFKAVS